MFSKLKAELDAVMARDPAAAAVRRFIFCIPASRRCGLTARQTGFSAII